MSLNTYIKNRPHIVHALHQLRFFSHQLSSVNTEVILRNFAERGRNVFFIQVGSNDGINGDPLHSLIKKYRWKGLLVEPLPEVFARLKENYADMRGLYFENSLIFLKEGKQSFYSLKEFNGHNSSQVSSLLFDVISKQKPLMPDFAERFTVRQVNAITFATLLAKYRISNINLLHIDAEGYDYEILRMVDFTKIKPAIVLFESEHLDAETYEASLNLLRKAGYPYLFRDGHDTIAVRSREYL